MDDESLRAGRLFQLKGFSRSREWNVTAGAAVFGSADRRVADPLAAATGRSVERESSPIKIPSDGVARAAFTRRITGPLAPPRDYPTLLRDSRRV